MQPTINRQRVGGGHVKDSQLQSENQNTEVEEETDQKWNKEDHDTPQGRKEENDDGLLNEEINSYEDQDDVEEEAEE